MKITKRILSVGLVLMVLVCSLSGFSFNVTAASSKTLYLNSELLKAVGTQPAYTYTCACYALAYCRTMLDNKVHYYSEYNKYGADHYNASCVWGWGDYTSTTAKNRAGVFKACYDSINNNRPIIVHVNHSKNGQHWVAVVGYQNVTDVNNMSESNLLVIDSIHGFRGAPETLSNYSLNSSLRYVVANSGSVSGSTIEYTSIENGEYYLKNIATGTYLSVDGGVDAQAQNVSVAGFTGGNEMKFSLVSESNGYAIRPLCSSSRMLNVYADNVVSQKNVCIYDNTNHGSQRWYFESVDGGYVIHNSQNPNCVLDVYGTNVWVYDSYGAQSQKWVLEPVDKVEYPGTPVLKVTASTAESYTQFLFGNTDNTDEYELKIHDANTGERVYYYTAIQGTNFQAQLEKGTYIAYPVAVNNDLRDTDRWWTSGSGVSFTVGDAKSIEAIATTTYGDSKYALYDVVMPWSEAKLYCESMGGHLVTMASKEEYEAIQNLILKGNSAVYWIGYTDAANEGDFTAINSEKDMYTVWDDGEPNDYESNEDCAVLINNSNSKMNDLNNMYANYSVGFICEFKVEPETDPETEPSHTHEYVLTESIPADCTHTGHNSYTCSCGDGYIEWFEPNGKHVYSEEWTVLHTPTETERGVGCKLCVYCNTQGHYIRINQDWSYEYVISPNPDDWIEDDVVEGDIMRWFKEYSAEIADENTGDIRFFWSEVEDAINYNLMVYTEEGTSLLNITTTELNYVWSPEQYDSGIFFVTATSNEGKVFAKSGGTHFARNHNLINQNYGVYGDVDNNGKINIKDATLVQKSLAHVVELDITSEVLADVNADGKINIKDATTIQKHCAFISVTSRIGEKCTTGIPKYSIKVNQ